MAYCKKLSLDGIYGKQTLMDGENKVIGLWRGREGAQSAPSVSPAETPHYLPDVDEDCVPTGRWKKPLAVGLCLLLAFGWIGAVATSRYLSWAEKSPALDDVLNAVAVGSAPLALIAVMWMLVLRSSRAEADRFSQTAHALRAESERMDTVLAFVSARIEASRRELAEQGDTLLNLGEGAASRLNDVTNAMRREIDTITGHTQTLKGTTAAARGDLAVLLSHLPKAQVQMRQIASALVEAGTTAQDKAVLLAEQVADLSAKSIDAGENAQKSASELSGQLAGLIGQSESFAALVQESEVKLRAAGSGATEQLGLRVKEIGAEVDQISATFETQDEASRSLLTRVSSDLGDLEARFAAFDAHGKDRAEQLTTALATLQEHATGLYAALGAGDGNIEALKGKTEALLSALDSASREIDDTLPAAYGRLEATATQALSVVNQAIPAMSHMAKSAETTRDHLSEAENVVERQRDALAAMTRDASSTLENCRTEADTLAFALAEATAQLRGLSESAGANLIESLVRARDTARQAAEHARDAFNDVIPQTAASFGEQSKQALGDALTAQVEAQMKEIAATTEKAVAAAQKATDRLMRQMLTISETSSALETRISEAKEEAERSDHSNFARRVALLIESLNSAAIDVTKILSNDVTDTAWAAYLRGDRGIFARRAVKLIDASEAKEIARHYQDDNEFREQVNRYIHDYEAMLRSVMATRDGTPLSVALLSSDTGKLYVALAQAIERLRT